MLTIHTWRLLDLFLLIFVTTFEKKDQQVLLVHIVIKLYMQLDCVLHEEVLKFYCHAG